jgi:hypothetical protein
MVGANATSYLVLESGEDDEKKCSQGVAMCPSK